LAAQLLEILLRTGIVQRTRRLRCIHFNEFKPFGIRDYVEDGPPESCSVFQFDHALVLKKEERPA
jgi:hypothetical protein